MSNKRWRAVINYFDGSYDKFQFDEFDELGEEIERGPNWNLVSVISIHLNDPKPIGSNK